MRTWLFFLTMALASSADAGSKLLFIEEVRVLNERIRLVDLVDSKTLSEDEVKRLSEISIAMAPKENAVLTFEERALAQLVRVHRLNERFEAPVKIPNEVRVIGPEAAWNETNFRIHLAAVAKQPHAEIKIEGLRLPPVRPWMESAKWTIDKSMVTSWKGSVSIPVKFKRVDGKETTEWVSAQIRHLKPSPVSLKYLKFGQLISQDDFTIEMRDVGTSIDGSLSSEQMIGRRLKKAVPVGQIIWAGDIEKQKFVERGQSVNLTIETSGLKIRMTAIAQEDGGLGDRVRIQNQESKKIVSAVVVGQAQVELR